MVFVCARITNGGLCINLTAITIDPIVATNVSYIVVVVTAHSMAVGIANS